MSKSYFIMFSTDPEVDPRKCAVGLACAAQAVSDGHKVEAFFASHAVKLLQRDYIGSLDSRVSQEEGFCRGRLDALVAGANGIHCSTGSQAIVGVTPENASEILVEGLEMNWSGPPGVIALSAEAEVGLAF